MHTTVAVDVSDESSVLDANNVDIPEFAGLGRRRTLALIASIALSAAGYFYALVKTLAGPKPGSAAEAAEQFLRRSEEPSALALAIVIVLMVAVASAAAAVTLRRHADS